METETKLEEYRAELISDDEGGSFALLLKVPDNPQKIMLSDTDQKDLDKVFYALIDELLRKPFTLVYDKNQNTELLGMDQACEKFVQILDNDLQGILDEGKEELLSKKTEVDE